MFSRANRSLSTLLPIPILLNLPYPPPHSMLLLNLNLHTNLSNITLHQVPSYMQCLESHNSSHNNNSRNNNSHNNNNIKRLPRLQLDPCRPVDWNPINYTFVTFIFIFVASTLPLILEVITKCTIFPFRNLFLLLIFPLLFTTMTHPSERCVMLIMSPVPISCPVARYTRRPIIYCIEALTTSLLLYIACPLTLQENL